ncbi:hypothetical protein Tco_0974117 [Tanacetum coccineum]|uniref:Retrovirus-related Pol polyprotein from transposon TNT 1-94 n=1 Tax=Tanacetum coccineum TaxID=301880 RepID=A0ABQ5EAN9_9ASTR
MIGMNVYGKYATKMELTWNKAQQGVRNRVITYAVRINVVADIENKSWTAMQGTNLLSHWVFSTEKLVSFVTEITPLSIDIYSEITVRRVPTIGIRACLRQRQGTSGGIQFLSDKLVSWMSKKQNCTAMSSAKAEYVALSASCAQVMWMRTQLQDYGFNYNKIPLYCDSQSAIAISCNPVQHSRTKHIHTRYHFIKEQVENGIIELYFVRTEYQLADMFTKALPEDRFKYLVRRIGMRCLTPADLEVLTNETA